VTVRRLVIIIALLVIVPVIEIAVLIAIGQVIGLGWTLLLMLGTSALGGYLLRSQGSRAWRAFRADVDAGRPPGNAATDGLLVLLGGVFMLVPGFVSDLLGLFLIAPPTRRIARAVTLSIVASRISSNAATSLFGPRKVRAWPGAPQRPGPAATAPSEAIEGEIIDPH
jgi:UPF0716 protein FxsA